MTGINPRLVEVTFDSRPIIRTSTYRFLTNPMLEMGAIYCRVLLEFLGISLNKPQDHLANGRRRGVDDVGIEHFGLDRLGVCDVLGAPFGEADVIERACVTTIRIAHKAVAHLTAKREPNDDIRRLHLCSKLVPWLVCRHLYEALGMPHPDYQFGYVG